VSEQRVWEYLSGARAAVE
jgi:hypothetical protein